MMKQLIFGRGMYLDTDIKAGQLVKVTSNESVSLCESGIADGVALFDGVTGDKVTIELFCKGVTSVIASGSISAGDEVNAATGGKAVKITQSSTYVQGFGKAITGGTTGDEITVMVH